MSSTRSLVKSFFAIGNAALSPAPAVSGDMSADIVGPSTQLDRIDAVCFQVSWTSASAVGVISVQGSVDGITFEDLTFATPLTQPASNNGSYLINLSSIPFSHIRLKYTRTSGAGALTVYMSAKGN